MTDKKTEALKLALEALRDYRRSDDDRVSVAMGLLQEALAQSRSDDEQPAQPSKPLTDEQILSLVPGLQDCLCDPWDYNNSGDYYASIPKDMIRLARAIEAAHGIKEKNA